MTSEEKDMLAKDMKWPHCKGSIVPENTWNTGLPELMQAILGAKGGRWWWTDAQLKYLEIHIDTRDNAFILRDRDGTRIDPQRVVDAIQRSRGNV